MPTESANENVQDNEDIQDDENVQDNEEAPEIWSNYEIEEFLDKVNSIKPVPVKNGEIAVLETSMGIIKFKFFPDLAPNHCASFKKLANNGFYDWTLFHRVAINFVVQGGDIYSKNDDPRDDGSGDPGFTLDAEFNDLSHKRGMVSTARLAHDINSATSQFFIMHAPHPRLNGEYTVFAQVIDGMDVVDEIAETAVVASRPVDPVYIKKVRVAKNKSSK